MRDEMRARVYGLLRSSSGTRLAPVRWTGWTLSFVNDLLGRPLAPEEELRERGEYESRRRSRRAPARAVASTPTKPVRRDVAPVVIYVDGRSHRESQRIETVFRGREIPFTRLDVENDEATRSWIRT